MPSAVFSAFFNFIRALRLPFITASVLPFILGSSLAGNNLNVLNFALGLICVMATHLAANLANDYADSKSGADWHDKKFYGFFGGSKLIQENVLSEDFYFKAAGLFAAAAFISAILLAFSLRKISVIIFYLAVLGLALSYSVKPLKFSYRKLGELTVFILFGPAPVIGGYFIQTGISLSPKSFFVSLPVGFLTTAILFANEVPDFLDDRASGKETLLSLAGREKAYIIYYLLTFSAFLTVALSVVLGYLPPAAFFSFIFAGLALKSANVIKRYPDDKARLVESSKLTILLHGLVCICLISAGVLWPI